MNKANRCEYFSDKVEINRPSYNDCKKCHIFQERNTFSM